MTKRDIQEIQRAINVLLKHGNSDKYKLDTEHYFFDAAEELENLINYLKRNSIIGDFKEVAKKKESTLSTAMNKNKQPGLISKVYSKGCIEVDGIKHEY